MAVIKVSCGFFGGSLMEALEQAKAGDTLLVAPGKYCHETLRLENITLKSEIPGAAIILILLSFLEKFTWRGLTCVAGGPGQYGREPSHSCKDGVFWMEG
jgi:hypothetical protein